MNTPKINQAASQGIREVDGFHLKYSLEGTGTPTLVIGSSLYYSRTFSVALRKQLRMAFVDHRGYAQYTGPQLDTTDTAPFELAVLLNDIELIRQKLCLGKVIIIGHSGHGYMALEYAKKYPQHVSHVVLIGVGPDQSPKSHAAAQQYLEDSVSPERKLYLAESLKQLPLELEANPEKRFITYCLRLGALSWYDYTFDASPLWQDVIVNMQMIDYVWGIVFRDIDITKGLDTFDKPVLLALGRYDFLVAPPCSWQPLRPLFKNLTMRIFEESSHTPQYEQPEIFDKELLAWLGSV